MQTEPPLYLTDTQFKALEILSMGLSIIQQGATKCVDSEGYPAVTLQTMESLTRLRLATATREEGTGRRIWTASPKGNEIYESMKDTGPLKRPRKAKSVCPGCGYSRGLCLCSHA